MKSMHWYQTSYLEKIVDHSTLLEQQSGDVNILTRFS